jgi:hypothetical protein
MDDLRRDRGRDAVAHRARAGRELRAIAPEDVVKVAPDRVVARAVRQDRVGGEPPAEVLHDVANIELPRPAAVAQARHEITPRRLRPGGAAGGVDRIERACRRKKLR